MADDIPSIQTIRAAIDRAGAQWEAGTTSLSQLSSDDRRRRLGAVPPPGEMSIDELESVPWPPAARRSRCVRWAPPRPTTSGT